MSNYLHQLSDFHHPQILSQPNTDLSTIVVIPCYNETELIKSLESIYNCEKPIGKVEVIVVFNSSETDSEKVLLTNSKMSEKSVQWGSIHSNDSLHFYFIQAIDLPHKYAGVGFARKIGMDEAVLRFEKIKKDGIIACFDADSTCESNYLVELEKHFFQNPKSPACSIHFEHPIEGNDFSEANYQAIEAYELHLRLYKNAIKYCGFPFSYHTIGSSMAVKSKAYQKQGGMNKRKAGEDFYFLQKMMLLGNFSELVSTTVFPSPRISDRVPFGTGRAMSNYLSKIEEPYTTYSLHSYLDLQVVVQNLSIIYEGDLKIPDSISEYLKSIDFNENIKKIKNNSTSFLHFKQLFFNWFNAFKVLKFMHFARDNHYPDVGVFDAAREFLKWSGNRVVKKEELLCYFRKIDKLTD